MAHVEEVLSVLLLEARVGELELPFRLLTVGWVSRDLGQALTSGSLYASEDTKLLLLSCSYRYTGISLWSSYGLQHCYDLTMTYIRQNILAFPFK